MEKEEKSVVETITNFVRGSVSLKLISVFILMLMLMIPMQFVHSLISERQGLRQSAVKEVSDKWSGSQDIYGPILTLPYNRSYTEDGKVKVLREEMHILPSMLRVKGNITPETLRRGIYEVVVYNSTIAVSGSFEGAGRYAEELSGDQILWNEAFITVHISDLRGIKERVTMTLIDNKFQADPGTQIPGLVASGITVKNIFPGVQNLNELSFSFDLVLQGSSHLGFAPLGKETHVELSSSWGDPSFSGAFLPDDREIRDNGFTATYKILELNRNYPQNWIGEANSPGVQKSIFGVELLLPVDDYLMTTRSAKYALLAIVLTFLTFFLTEIFSSKRVHPFQYLIIGLALVLYYTLLISISEHTDFTTAYSIASIAIIGMIGLYSKAILKNPKQTGVLVLVLVLTYTFVYITLQLQDYALLIGSIGLTAILGFTMYITRNVNWYNLGAGKNNVSEK
ncbi:MAG: Inner membrane protein CreD [Ignavibacteriaceae bacterium]|nr:Inner membrane protein CreD [Ignavibacteriaceae bacterium]